ncbi:MAG: rod shape-determining protein MreD [Dehalococcoidia bacterium]
MLAAILAWGFAVLDVSVMPYIHPLGVSPDLVLIFAVCWAVIRGHEEALIVVPLCGFIQDFTTSDPIGTSVLALAPVVPLATAVRLRAIESDFLPTMTAVMGASACYGVISMVVLSLTGQEIALFYTLFRVILPAMVINALFTPILYMPMHWLSPRPAAWLQGTARLPSSL